jgi:O-6-methylguanine DNA methyltransferase
MKATGRITAPHWFFRLWGTPVGPLFLTFTSQGLSSLKFSDGAPHFATVLGSRPLLDLDLPPPNVAAMMGQALQALTLYFAVVPTDFFPMPLDLQGSPFQLAVWQKLKEVPSGVTISYKELASRVDNPRGTRAVGQALAANPLPIIIPCHRVIAQDGSLGGYRAGLHRKRWLLRHEGILF